MKKLWILFRNWIINKGIDEGVEISGDFMEMGLEDFYKTQPKMCELMVTGFYFWIPTLQTLALKTKTTIDDKEVAEAKAEIEEFAVRHNLILYNLDTKETVNLNNTNP